MKYLSYGVMVYMLLALIWWAVLLSRNNQTLGIKLERPEQIIADLSMNGATAPFEIKQFNQYTWAFGNLLMETLNRRTEMLIGFWIRMQRV